MIKRRIKVSSLSRRILIGMFLVISFKSFSQDQNILYTPQGNISIQSFDLSDDGRRLVMSVFPFYEAVVIDVISGNELIRLPGENSTPTKLYFDEGSNRIIVQYFARIYVWDATNYTLISTFDQPAHTSNDLNENSDQMVFLSTEKVSILSLTSGEIKIFPRKGKTGFSDKVKFSKNGAYIFELADGKLRRHLSHDYNTSIKFQSEGFMDFIVSDNVVITLAKKDNASGSKVLIQFHSQEGETTGKAIHPRNVFQLLGASMQPFNDQMLLYSSYNVIDLINKNGQETKFNFDQNVLSFEFNKNLGFVVNYGKQIDIKDAEGGLINRIYGKSLFHSGSYLDQETGTYCFVSEDKLTLQPGDFPEEAPIQLESPFVNQFSGDGELFAFGTRDKKIHIWNIQKKQSVDIISLQGEYPQFLSISEDRGIVAAVFRSERKIKVFEINNQTLLTELNLQGEVPTALDLTSKWLVAGSDKGKYSSWKIEDRIFKPSKSMEVAFNTPITSIEVSGNTAYLASNGRMYQVSLSSNLLDKENLLVGHESYIHSMSLDESGKYIVSSSVDGKTKLWDTEHGHLLETIQMDSAWVNQVSLRDSLLITASGPGIVLAALYNPALYSQLKNPYPELLIQSSNTSASRQLAFSPDGKLLANTDGDRIRVREVQTGFMISELTTRDNTVNDITFDQSGSSLIVATGKGIEFFDPVTGKSKKYIDLQTRGRSIHQVEVFPVKNILVAVNHHAWHEPLFLHLNSGQNLGGLAYNMKAEKDKVLLDFKIAPNEKWIATYGSHFIKIFEIDDQFRFNQVLAIQREVPDVSNKYWSNLIDISSDSRYLSYVEFSKPNQTKVYDLIERKNVLVQDGKLSEFGSDNQLLMMSSDITLKALDLSTKDSYDFHSTNSHNSLIQALAYDQNRDLFASSDIWGNMKIWSGKDGKTLKEIERFSNDIYHAEISPYGDFIAYNNKKGIFLFDLTQVETIKLDGSNYPYFGSFSSDNKYFYFRKGAEYQVFDLSTYTQHRLFDSRVDKDNAGSTKVSEDGQLLTFEDKETDEYLVYDLTSNTKKISYSKNGVGNYTTFSASRFSGVSPTSLLGMGIKDEGNKKLSLTLLEYDFERSKHKTLSKKRFLKVENMDGMDGVSMRYNMRINAISPDKKYYAYLDNYHLKIENLVDGEILYDKYSGDLETAVFAPEGNFLIIGYEGGKVKILSTDNFDEVNSFIGAKGDISMMSVRGNYLLVLGADEKINVFDINQEFKKLYSCAFVDEGEFVITNEEGFYYSSKGAIRSIAFKKGVNVYPFEQFDLFYNRPDLAVKNLVDLGITDSKLTQAFYKAYKKRLIKTGFDEGQLSGDFHLPSLKLNTQNLPVVLNTNDISFDIKVSDSLYHLDRINLWVNDVPVYGAKGKSIKALQVKQKSEQIHLKLTQGKNKIQVSVTNVQGAESLKTTYVVDCKLEEEKPSLYLVSIGASKYQNDQFNLKYAAKDAIDIIEYTKSLDDKYRTIETISLMDDQVTVQNIVSIKQQLMQSKTSDIVIIFYAGHGVLDKELDYFFATYDMDFLDPSQKGLPYESLEGLLDGIPARQKLLLVDACHSGEIDKDEVLVASTSTTKKGAVSFRGFTNLYSKKGELGLKNSFELMQVLFADLRRGTGAMVISSASGVEFAREGDDWNNGVFTYSLLEGLKTGKCDLNGDQKIQVSELREYVIGKVDELTEGKQHPTSRKENLEFDFSVW